MTHTQQVIEGPLGPLSLVTLGHIRSSGELCVALKSLHVDFLDFVGLRRVTFHGKNCFVLSVITENGK